MSIMRNIFWSAVLFTFIFSQHVESTSKTPVDFGLLQYLVGRYINSTLSKWIPVFDDIREGQFHTYTDQLEFGQFNLTLNDVTINGIETTTVKKIKVHVVPLRIENITVHLDSINFTAQNYDLNGHLRFPTENAAVVPLRGSNGTFRVGFRDITLSAYMVPRMNASDLWMQDCIVHISAGGMTFDVENLLGDTALGKSFNTIMNDTGIAMFNQYKGHVITRYLYNIQRTLIIIACVLFNFVCFIIQKLQEILRGLWDYHKIPLLTARAT